MWNQNVDSSTGTAVLIKLWTNSKPITFSVSNSTRRVSQVTTKGNFSRVGGQWVLCNWRHLRPRREWICTRIWSRTWWTPMKVHDTCSMVSWHLIKHISCRHAVNFTSDLRAPGTFAVVFGFLSRNSSARRTKFAFNDDWASFAVSLITRDFLVGTCSLQKQNIRFTDASAAKTFSVLFSFELEKCCCKCEKKL